MQPDGRVLYLIPSEYPQEFLLVIIKIQFRTFALLTLFFFLKIKIPCVFQFLRTCYIIFQVKIIQRDDYMGRKRRMSDDRYRQIERMLDEIEEGCAKIKEAEQYQELVKKDLSRLEGEKHAYLYRKNELISAIADTRGMAIISVTALGLCFALLLFLQFFMEMDTKAGYLITAGVAAFAITLIYVKHSEARRDSSSIRSICL